MRLYPTFRGGSETSKVAQLMPSPYLWVPSCSAHKKKMQLPLHSTAMPLAAGSSSTTAPHHSAAVYDDRRISGFPLLWKHGDPPCYCSSNPPHLSP